MYSDTKKPNKTLLFLLRIILWSCYSLAFVFCWLNAKPFIELMRSILADLNAVKWLTELWFVGFIFSFFFFSVHYIIGFLFWAAIQAFEVLPIYMKLDSIFLLEVIESVRSHKLIPINPEDDPMVVILKKMHNLLPLKIFRQASLIRWLAYIIDGMVSIAYYPPIEGGFSGLGIFMMSGRADLIILPNLLNFVLSLFACEALVYVSFFVRNFIDYLKRIYLEKGK